jgi:hypothetical protein
MKVQTIFSLIDFAKIKNCSRQTVHNNLRYLNQDSKGRIIWDGKAKKWMPNQTKTPNQFKK